MCAYIKMNATQHLLKSEENSEAKHIIFTQLDKCLHLTESQHIKHVIKMHIYALYKIFTLETREHVD